MQLAFGFDDRLTNAVVLNGKGTSEMGCLFSFHQSEPIAKAQLQSQNFVFSEYRTVRDGSAKRIEACDRRRDGFFIGEHVTEDTPVLRNDLPELAEIGVAEPIIRTGC